MFNNRNNLNDIPKPFLKYNTLAIPEQETVNVTASSIPTASRKNNTGDMIFLMLVLMVFYD